MAKYKIEVCYLQFPLFIETESDLEAYEAFTALCDYNGVDEDEIEVIKQDERGIVSAKAEVISDEDDYPTSYSFIRVS